MQRDEPLDHLPGPRLMELGDEALRAGALDEASRLLRAAVRKERAPQYLSLLALILAQTQDDLRESLSLCQEAVKLDPKSSVHFLRLGKIQMYAGRKKEAIRTLRLGMRLERDTEIAALLRALGTRRRPVLGFLPRSHPLNRLLGKMRSSWSRPG